MSGNLPSAGWFPDPQDPRQQRYWNGSEWTAHTAPGAAAAPGYGAAPYGAPGYGASGYSVTGVRETAPGASAALILGILSLVVAGFFTGIPAMVLARRATREADASPGRYEGRGLATAGFVTGLIGTVWSGLVLVLLIIGIAVGLSRTTS